MISKLFAVADQLQVTAEKIPEKELEKLENVAESYGKSWGGSCLGYHARVYYKDFAPVPPGARFSQEWGFKDSYMLRETIGEWEEHDFDSVVSLIRTEAGIENTDSLEEVAHEATELFEEKQSEVLSLITPTLVENEKDTFFFRLGREN